MRKDKDVILIDRFIAQTEVKIMVYAGQIDELKKKLDIEYKKLDDLLEEYREKQEEIKND